VNTASKRMIETVQFKSVRGQVRLDEPMSAHTSWKVGGPARYFFEPVDEADIAQFLAELDPEMPVLWVGLGSNLLVRDGGYPGAVIAGHRGLRELNVTDSGVFAQSGVSCAPCRAWPVNGGSRAPNFLPESLARSAARFV